MTLSPEQQAQLAELARRQMNSATAPLVNPALVGPALKEVAFSQTSNAGAGRFIIILGPPFSGKSTACMTFPKPHFLDLDNKAPAGAMRIDFSDPAVCDSLAPRTSPALPPNKRDAILNWLYRSVAKLPRDITLILDGLSALSDAFHLQAEQVEELGISKAGNKAALKVFGGKLTYLEVIFTLLKLAPCRVIVTAHTMPEYNEGGPTGRIKPLVSGSFSDKLIGYATDCFRAYVMIDVNTGKPTIDPRTGECTAYRWRLKPDKICQFTNTLLNLPPTKLDIQAKWSELEALINATSAPVPASVPAAASPTGASVTAS